MFSILNNQKCISDYDQYIKFENTLDEFIMKKIKEFKDNYRKLNNIIEFDSKDKYAFRNIIEERYKVINHVEYPFYEYFYYFNYINEDYLLNYLNHSEKDKFPVLLKYLENHYSNKKVNLYSLEKLPLFNKVLNLFSESYSYQIKRDKAKTLPLKGETIYSENKNLIDDFINYYNYLQIKNEKNNSIMKLSPENYLCDFFIDDNNDFGRSYKKIYKEFIKEENKEILPLLNNKIEKQIFEKNCKDEINIQSASPNEIFIINNFSQTFFLNEAMRFFSFNEKIFNCSYRKFALYKDEEYNLTYINYDLLENQMTEILLRNKKLFNDSITTFVYFNEDLTFENTNLITTFIDEYEVTNDIIDIEDKKILYKFFKENEEKENLLNSIFQNFNELILFLNNNKKVTKQKSKKALIFNGNNKIYETFPALEGKVSQEFKDLFNNKDNLIIYKIPCLFEYYRNLIFKSIKKGLAKYQIDIKEEKKELIEKCLKDQTFIDKDILREAIRNFIILFLNLVKDKENKVKNNQNNFVIYFDIRDIWPKNIYNKSNDNFKKELENLQKMEVNLNQILSLYNYLGDNINEDYFKDVKKAIERENDAKKEEELKEQEPYQSKGGNDGNNYDNDEDSNSDEYDDDNAFDKIFA